MAARKARLRRWLSLVLALTGICLAACHPGQPDDARAIAGVWRVAEIAAAESSTGDSVVDPTTEPLPSQIMFIDNQYSMVWMPGTEAITAFSTRWQPTDVEKIRRFGEIGFNTGTYEIEAGRIIMHPRVARVPEFMGGHMVYEYAWSGRRLVLTLVDEHSFDGVRAPWTDGSSGVFRLVLARLEDQRSSGLADRRAKILISLIK